MSDVLARLDVLTSFAEVAAAAPMPYVRPILHDEGAGVMILKQMRHPCLEVQDGISFIANDVYFKQGKEGRQSADSQLLNQFFVMQPKG
jgi:DNA mismatch repair protein MSH2